MTRLLAVVIAFVVIALLLPLFARFLEADHEVRSAAAGSDAPAQSAPIATADITYDIDALMQNLDVSARREEAYALLCNLSKEEDLAKLHAGYQSLKTAGGRWRAAWVLGEVGSSESIPLLTSALLDDKSLYVRRGAAYSLGRTKSFDALRGLYIALVDDEESTVRQRAAWAVDQLSGRGAESALRNALDQEEDAGTRRGLRWLLDYERKGAQAPQLVPGEAHFGVFKDTQYKVYLPSNYTPDREWPLLVSVHGTDGHPNPYEKMWRSDAELHGFVVLAPFFDPPNFPMYDSMQPRQVRSDFRVLDIISILDGLLSLSTDEFYLFGHSKGGQFVTRFVVMHPDRIIKAAACASGNYVYPDANIYFPHGLKRHPFFLPSDRLDMDAMLRVPMAVIIGTADLDRRKEAANKFMTMTHEYAANRGIKHQTQFISVEGGKHRGAINQPYAAEFFFGSHQK